MAALTGSQLLARSLRNQGADTLFFLMGGPMLAAESACIEEGLRPIDVRHEQVAAMMAHAYARLLRKPGVCMACSGPGATNLVTGIANAFVDCAPVIAIAGSSPLGPAGRGLFQELDQVSLFKPITKWAERVLDARRIPELVSVAFRQALSGRPGPVYLDLPGDVLYQKVDEAEVVYPDPARSRPTGRSAGDPALVRRAIELLERAERPILVSGSGSLWSDAGAALQQWVDLTGMPFYTTPQGRGVVPDDHELSFPAARSTAFREADQALVVGTRLNWVVGHLSPPRFRADLRVIQVDVEPTEIGRNRTVEVGIVGDARAVLQQLTAASSAGFDRRRYAKWRDHLR
ncbi:MAG: thiamine pyrophosphate-binding protein, partial [Chloroflexi bacterium]|nr:thiamine pyrophosphate-binding protein [Chloroflexota bacterium]